MSNVKRKTTTAKKTKAKKVQKLKVVTPKAVKEPKATAAAKNRNYIENPAFSLESRDGEKSGEFIKRLLQTEALTNDEIVAAVHENFKGLKTGLPHVAFYRALLKKQGTRLQVVRLDKEGKRYVNN